MTITPSQRITISQLWNKVCKDRGWKSGDRALRLATLGELLGRDLTTMDDIERIAECTKVMNGLKVMLGVSIKAGMEVGDPTLNQARVFKHKILNELMPCLELYEADVQGYLTSVMEDKNRWWKIDRPACEISLEDLDAKPIIRRVKNQAGEWLTKEFASTLEQLLMTINARLNTKRKAAGHSGHEMKLLAKVFCDCAKCEKARLVAGVIPALPAGADQANSTAQILGHENPF
jgi:hypothetical protein